MRVKKIVGFAVGPIGTAVLGVFLVPITAWLFPPADLGRLNIFQVLTSLSLLFFVLGLDQAYVREYHESRQRARLLRSCLAPGLAALALFAAVSLPFSESLSVYLYDSNNAWLYICTVLAFFASHLSRFLSLIMRMQERGLAFSMSQVLPKLLQLVLVLGIGVSLSDRSFQHLLLASLLSILSVLVVSAWYTRNEWKAALSEKANRDELSGLIRFGLPLVAAGLAYWGLTAISTFTLRRLSSLPELAIYSVANSFANAAIVFQAIFSIVWAPTVYRWVAEGVDLKRIEDIAQQALAIISVIVVAFGATAWLTDWLLPHQYLQVKYLLLCSAMPPLLYTLSEITCIGIGITRRSSMSMWITMGALTINFILGISLIPMFGAKGAVVSNAIAFLGFFVGRTEVSARIWMSFSRIKMYATTTSFVILAVMIALFGSRSPYSLGAIWILLIPVVYFLFKQQWQSLFRVALRRMQV